MHRVPRFTLIAAAAVAACTGAHAATYSWTNGNFVAGVTAPEPLLFGDTLSIDGGGNKFFNAVTFTNQGVVTWNVDTLYFQSGATVLNQGLWDATGDYGFVYNGGASPSFLNSGTFRKSGGSGATTIGQGTGFVNTGTVDVQSGRIEFQGGSRFENGSVFSGAGTAVMTGGTNTFAGAYTAASLVLQGGTFAGESAVAGGLTRWTGGTLTGSWAVAAGATLQGQAGGNKILNAGTLTNAGTLSWETGDALYLQSGAVLDNHGLVEFGQGSSIVYNGGAAVALQNQAGATLRAKAGTTLTVGSSTGLVNQGTLEAQAGAQIRYQGGSTFAAGSSFSGAGANVAIGNNTFSGAYTSGNLVLEGGSHFGDGALAQGTTTYTGGHLTGTWTVAGGATINANAGANKIVNGASLTNAGTIAWNSGDALYLQSGAVLTNQGLFVASESTSVFYNGGASPTFDNTGGGVVRAAAGKQLTFGGGSGLVNAGTLEALAGGAIVLQGGAQLNAGSRYTGAGSVYADNTNTFAGLQQSDNLVLRSGTHVGSGAVVGGSVAFTGGALTGDWTVAAGQGLDGNAGNNKFVNAGTLTNAGTVNWNTGDLLYLQSGGTVQNQALWQSNASTSIAYNGGSATTFLNTGTVRAADATTLTFAGGSGLLNQGTLDARGTIVLAGGATLAAGSRFTGSGSVYADNTNTFRGAYDSQSLVLRSGTHVGDGAVMQGRTSWTGGALTGDWRVASGQVLAAGGGNNKFINAGTLVNQGRVEWGTGDALYLQSAGVLRNEGVVDVSANTTWAYNGGTALSIVNTGLIVKSGGAGSFTIGDGTGFVNQGTLNVASGTIVLPTNFTNDGTLKGSGAFSLNGTLTNNGHLAPGASPGTLTLNGHLLQTAGGFLDTEIGTLAASDLLLVNGNATLGGTLALSCYGACSLSVGDQLVILDATGSLSGTFAGVTLAGFGSGAFDVVYDTAGSRVLLEVTQTVSAVPEPGTWAMWLAGLAAMGSLAARRKASLVA